MKCSMPKKAIRYNNCGREKPKIPPWLNLRISDGRDDAIGLALKSRVQTFGRHYQLLKGRISFHKIGMHYTLH